MKKIFIYIAIGILIYYLYKTYFSKEAKFSKEEEAEIQAKTDELSAKWLAQSGQHCGGYCISEETRGSCFAQRSNLHQQFIADGSFRRAAMEIYELGGTPYSQETWQQMAMHRYFPANNC